jgi:hypothetical protein
VDISDACPQALKDELLEEDQDQVDCVVACDGAASCEALDGSDPAAAEALATCQDACNG